jgi:glycosyltransferase involved in cell wall biosynthesis
LQTARLKRYEIHQLQKADAWVPISKEDAAGLKRLVNADMPIYVAPSGIEIKYRKQQQAYKDLLFVGSLDWEPNRMGLNWFFLKIWPLLCQAHHSIQITLIGRGAQKYAKGILQCTAFDFVPDLSPYYESHHVVIIPILHGGGMRIKLLEAMAFGMPVVTTTKGNQGLNAQAGQHVCVADTASDFLNAIVLLLSQPELRHQFQKAAHDWVQKEFNQTQIMQGMFSQYQHWINTLCAK